MPSPTLLPSSWSRRIMELRSSRFGTGVLPQAYERWPKTMMEVSTKSRAGRELSCPTPQAIAWGNVCCKSWLLSPSPCVATSIAIAIEGWPITMYQQSTKSRVGRELAGRELSCPTPPSSSHSCNSHCCTSHRCNSNQPQLQQQPEQRQLQHQHPQLQPPALVQLPPYI